MHDKCSCATFLAVVMSEFGTQVEIEAIATEAKSGGLMSCFSFFQYPNFIDGINISQIQHSWEEYSPLLGIKNRLSLFFLFRIFFLLGESVRLHVASKYFKFS